MKFLPGHSPADPDINFKWFVHESNYATSLQGLEKKKKKSSFLLSLQSGAKGSFRLNLAVIQQSPRLLF